jgi:putative glutathione S-transferase
MCGPTTIQRHCAKRSIASTQSSTRTSTTASTAPDSRLPRRPTRRRSAHCSPLDEIEQRLSRQRYLAGREITEADWRLFTTLVRFDAVYYGHFKCNLRRIVDYPNLSNYLRDLYQQPGIAGTVNMDHIKRHYYGSHRNVNPTGIVPLGPQLDFLAPHDRGRFTD